MLCIYFINYKLIVSSIFKSLKIKRIYFFSLCGLYKYYVGEDRFEHMTLLLYYYVITLKNDSLIFKFSILHFLNYRGPDDKPVQFFPYYYSIYIYYGSHLCVQLINIIVIIIHFKVNIMFNLYHIIL